VALAQRHDRPLARPAQALADQLNRAQAFRRPPVSAERGADPTHNAAV
jgi:hypothetical protein